MSVEQRRVYAELSDFECDPSNEAVRDKLWTLQAAITDEIDDLKRDLSQLVPGGLSDWAKRLGPDDREKTRASRESKLAALEAQERELLHAKPAALPSVVERLIGSRRPPENKPKRGGGRRPHYKWPPVMAKLREQLEEDGAPEDGDGGQGKLEEFVASLFPPDNCPTKSLRREKVREAIEAHRRAVNVQGR